jgi:hypothetical protein
MIKTALKFGLISGGTMLLAFSISYFIFPHTPDAMAKQEVIGYLGIFLGLAVIFFAIKHHRDHKLNGKISFGKAFGLGMVVASVAGLIMGIFTIVLLAWIYPDFGQDYMNYYLSSLESANLSPEVLAAKKLELSQMGSLMNNLPFQGLVMMLTVVFIGILHSLVSALVLKKG